MIEIISHECNVVCKSKLIDLNVVAVLHVYIVFVLGYVLFVIVHVCMRASENSW